MKAITQNAYGGSETLEMGEADRPKPQKGEVLVRVHAAAIDRGTWHLMAGEPLVARLMFGLRKPRNPVPGRDLAGIVAEVGPEVDGWSVGDEVIGTANGSLAEYAVVPVTRLARKPANASFEEAAVLSVSGLTALQAVRDVGRVSEGDRVLVIGASGGVGAYAVQIAAARGAEVVAVASGAKAEWVRSLGAREVIDYARGAIDPSVGPFDVIIDIAGRRRISVLRRLLTPRGTLVIVGGEGGGKLLGGTERQLGAIMMSLFVKHRLTSMLAKESADDMAVLAAMVEAGSLQPTLDRTFALEETTKAMDYLTEGQVRGKIAVTI
ncbi:NAD(P)-dependent alcohol dehydrogenase [Gordonia rhizosphera]|uniref:Putative oxidoreductase n=1 Tax=Gordonia rhizosphera NBRC 16068 TaxID=1108045 RepID=K6W923_9ACTN|nr:NAD(P)-dependent alcohol dehydrogenase [Gordonia rhizosphera]GAB90246.1 putative oxidoreductase [Gordonia rhizosphera NBRC 16068]